MAWLRDCPVNFPRRNRLYQLNPCEVESFFGVKSEHGPYWLTKAMNDAPDTLLDMIANKVVESLPDFPGATVNGMQFNHSIGLYEFSVSHGEFETVEDGREIPRHSLLAG